MRGRLRALDLFCGAGGATKGLQRAGFHVIGLDVKPQPRYCGDAFIQADALRPPVDLSTFGFIWASPPCQHSSWSARRWRNAGKEYPDLIEPARQMLEASGKPFCIENVVGAPMWSLKAQCSASRYSADGISNSTGSASHRPG